MEQENKNKTSYICGICNTKPEQLSHHNAHLNSIAHSEKKIICEYNIRRYIVEFLFLVDNEYWNNLGFIIYGHFTILHKMYDW